MPHPTDTSPMLNALDLARQGIGLTSPNPNVGAVLVDDTGNVVGSGTHTYAGLKHAEILAIEQAGTRARGATLYINLVPIKDARHHAPTLSSQPVSSAW